MTKISGGVLGQFKSLSVQDTLEDNVICVPSFNGGGTKYPHHGWVSTSIMLIQVSKNASPKTNGKLQFPQPVDVAGGNVGGSVVADQIARNPAYFPLPLDLNVTIKLLELLM